MIEYNNVATENDEVFEKHHTVTVHNDGKVSLAQLWEVILRNKRLPDGFDVDTLYTGVHERLRDPEREVRQHALRVLFDLIPVTERVKLDEHMRALVPELLSNLGHSAPALRKSALDSLRKYLRHSKNYDELLLKLVSVEQDNVITAAPFLVTRSTADETLKKVIDHLWTELNNVRLNQENVAKSLARIRYILGEDRFKSLMGLNRHKELQKICENYGLPIEYSDRESDSEKLYWNDDDETVEDKIILETEITLKTGPAITMKIHEESVSNSTSDGMADSEEDLGQRHGIVKVLENDNEYDFYEEARRTPRKVRFGGEQVKLRTPESDSSNQDDDRHTLTITVSDALSIRTKKSLIPVRITSLPATPKKQLPQVKKRLHKSTSDLSKGHKSKIPLKKDVSSSQEASASSDKRKHNSSDKTSSKDFQRIRPKLQVQQETSTPMTDLLSPPPHSEIEILHNLMRSPERKKELAPSPIRNEAIKALNEEKREEISAEPERSFQICSQPEVLATPPPKANHRNNDSIKEERFSSFQLVENKDDDKINRSRTPSPFSVNHKVTEINKEISRTSSPHLQSNKEIVNNCSKNDDMEVFQSFQVYSPKAFPALPPPASPSPALPPPALPPLALPPPAIPPPALPPPALPPPTSSRGEINNHEQIVKTEFESFKLSPETETVEDTEEANDSFDNFLGSSVHVKQHMDISSFSTEDDFWNKSEALDNLIKMLKQPNTRETLEPGPAGLLFEALFACQNLDKLHFLADDAIELMVRGLRTNVLEQCLGRLALGICNVGAPFGVNIAMLIMEKTQPKKLQTEIIDRCLVHRMREGALQVLMAASRLLPSSQVEVTKITEFAAMALRDRRRRVRHAALETLATLAQLSSITDVLDIVSRVTKTFPDQHYLLRVIRTRLSRRQLPTVESDGSIRYSTPHDQTEVDWLSGASISSPSSSASSSTPSVNYWRRNSRHDIREGLNFAEPPSQADGANGNQQIWAIDPAVLQRSGSIKEVGKGTGIFRPVYILQPEAVQLRDGGGRGYRKYDRGRSFSPPKRHQRKSFRDSAAGPSGEPIASSGSQTRQSGQQIAIAGEQATSAHQLREPVHQIPRPVQQMTGSAPHYASHTNLNKKIRQNEAFRKSFSTEQLFLGEKSPQESQYFSLSSRSSNTSTGSSVKNSPWQKEIRSGIPIPISSDKLRLRTSNTNNNSNNIGVGPVIALRSVLGSPVDSPIITRISPSHRNSIESREQVLSIPPQSSGSESSGYFTPVSETKQSFVKLNAEDNPSESGESSQNDKNNNSEDFVDSCKEPTKFVVENSLQRNVSISSGETSDVIEEISETKIDKLSIRSIESEREELRLNGFSTLIIKDSEFSDNSTNLSENSIKSRSVTNLHNSHFLPEINSSRKPVSSAPVLKDTFITTGERVITTTDLSTFETSLPEEIQLPLEIEETSEITITRKLSRRLSRSQSKRSIQSTPRSVHETTPKSSRSTNKPKNTLQQSLAQMSNPEWEIVIQGLQNLTKVAKHYPDVVEAQMHGVCVGLAKHIKNLRSQVARTACNTASELFASCKRGLDMELEEIAGPLLHRTADTNKFLRADANAALDVMCEHLPPHRVITVIITRGCLHQNGIVRSASMRLLKDLARRLGPDKIFHLQKDIRDKIFLAGANALADGSLEARSHGKSLFSCLSNHPNFQKALHDAVPQNILRHIAKTLSNLKPSLSGT